MTQTPHPSDGGPSGQSGPAAPPPPAPPPSPQPQTPWQTQAQSNRFWDDILSTGLRRDSSRQWFAGVCSGIARRVDVDPVLIRAAFIALTLFGGFGIVAYLVAWLLLPDDTGRIMAREALSRDASSSATGAIVLSVIAVLVIAAIVFGDNGFLIGWGIIPLAIVGWLFWRHQRQDGVSAWSPAAQGAPVPPPQTGPSMYAATSGPAPTAPTAPVAPGAPGAGYGGWQPPPAPPVPPRSWVPVAPPPPPRPRRRSAGFAGFALTLGMAAVGYGAGLMLDGPLDFSGSEELFGVILALGAAALTTLVIGLSGRRSIMSAGLVVLLGLGATAATVGEQTLEGDRGTRTWTPVLSQSPTSYSHGAGRTTLDLRPLFAGLAAPPAEPTPSVAPTAPGLPAPTATPTPTPSPPAAPVVPALPQEITVEQGAGELTIIVPPGATAQIRARADFGEVQVLGDLPDGLSSRDNGDNDGPSETVTLRLGSGAPTVTVRADITFGQITIKEG
jgi:phage shock protein PspC (stress-responsive transcriptional regulator)